MTKFLLLTKHDDPNGVGPMTGWPPEAVDAHMAYLRDLNAGLVQSGELVEALALAGPELGKLVSTEGTAPVATDGPYAELKEVVAGYQLVDVESEERAVEIAAKVSAAPGPDGEPIGQVIEVRQVMVELPGAGL
jgi:hypothetical protein